MRILLRLTIVVSTVGALIFAWQQSRLFVAHRIGDHASTQPHTARVTITQLRKLGDSAVPALLDAAVSPDRRVAAAARQQLEVLLLGWAGSRSTQLDEKAAEVVQGLIFREPRMTPSGRRWARKFADSTLRLATVSRGSTSPQLVAQIEQLLLVTRGVSQVADQPLPTPVSRVPVTLATPRLPALATLPAAETPQVDSQPPVGFPESNLSPGEPSPLAEVSARPLRILEPQDPLPEDPGMAAPLARGPGDLAWQPPGVTPDKPSETSAPSAPAPIAKATDRPGRRLPRHTPEPEEAIREPSPEVAAMLNGDQATKLQLIEQLLLGLHPNGANLLLRLAQDDLPTVRASAISALGASSNPELTKAAMRLALRDQDPRVARLAQELQKLIR